MWFLNGHVMFRYDMSAITQQKKGEPFSTVLLFPLFLPDHLSSFIGKA
jgi:hypothetical protein